MTKPSTDGHPVNAAIGVPVNHRAGLPRRFRSSPLRGCGPDRLATDLRFELFSEPEVSRSDIDPRYGNDTGFWTTAMFIETIYKQMVEKHPPAKPAQGKNQQKGKSE